MAKSKKFASIVPEIKPTVEAVGAVEIEEVIDPPTVDVKYIVVTAETTLANKHYFEETVSKKMWEGWKPIGGIDVKTISVNGWLFAQAMIKE